MCLNAGTQQPHHSAQSGHDHWEGGICSNEKPRLECDRQMAPQGIQRHKAPGLLWKDGPLTGSQAVRVWAGEAGGPGLSAPLFLLSWGPAVLGQIRSPSVTSLCKQKEPRAEPLSEGALASQNIHFLCISKVLPPKD